jgi:hypothetical protein
VGSHKGFIDREEITKLKPEAEIINVKKLFIITEITSLVLCFIEFVNIILTIFAIKKLGVLVIYA